MGHRRICRSEREYRTLEHSGELKRVIGAYTIGQRSSDILDTLARARVWSDNFGDHVPCPVGYDRTTWTDILDALVLGRLGNMRCLDCGGFYRSNSFSQCYIGLSPAVKADKCPHCGQTCTEVIGCTEGVV